KRILDNRFLERPQHCDQRHQILRPYGPRDTVVIGPNEQLTTANQPTVEIARIAALMIISQMLSFAYEVAPAPLNNQGFVPQLLL
ncbi:hypothetical protein AAGG49_22025, partial [Stenotrophomonas maltophilia]